MKKQPIRWNGVITGVLNVICGVLVQSVFCLAVSTHLAAESLELKVVGNTIVDSNGAVIRLKGINIPSLIWSNTGERILESVAESFDNWHANTLRLAVHQDRWFGAAGATDGGAGYRALCDAVVAEANRRGAYVLFDLHASSIGGLGKNNNFAHFMPDETSFQFWSDAAVHYKNHPSVLFELYNEPHDVSWSVWRNGGLVTGEIVSYQTPGHQAVLDEIRRQGAKNIVIANGLNWANDISGVVNGFALTESGGGNGIIYSSHLYPGSERNWDAKVTVCKFVNPILIGEYGHDGSAVERANEAPDSYCTRMQDWMDYHGYSYTGWNMHPGSTPAMITDWSYTPTTFWGQYIKDRLAGVNLTSAIQSGAIYKFTCWASGSVLESPHSSHEVGVQVGLWDWTEADNQRWEVTFIGDDYYKIVNVLSGLALEVRNGVDANGSAIQQAVFTGDDRQLWKFTDVGGKSYTISPKLSVGRVLDDITGSSANGALVQLYEGNASIAQRWTLTLLRAPLAVVNQVPTISAIEDQTISVNQTCGPLHLVVGDLETPADQLVVQAVSDHSTLVPNHRITLVKTGGNYTCTIVPLEGQQGTVTISISVTDGAGSILVETFVLRVTAAIDPTPPHVAPTIVTAAHATPNPVTGVSTQIDVLAADDSGENNLTYMWSSLEDGATFTPNGTHAAQSATVSFSHAGVFHLVATVSDASGATVSSAVTVTVVQTVSSLAVLPLAVVVEQGAQVDFNVTGLDQFGIALFVMPTCVWSATGGAIDAQGTFTAGGVSGEVFQATVQYGALLAHADITVTSAVGPTEPPAVDPPSSESPITESPTDSESPAADSPVSGSSGGGGNFAGSAQQGDGGGDCGAGAVVAMFLGASLLVLTSGLKLR